MRGIVVLDYDLTLLDNKLDFYMAFAETLSHYKGKVPDYSTFIELLNKNMLDKIIPPYVDFNEFWRMFRRTYRTKYLRLRAEAERSLLTLKNFGIITVIVTGREIHKQHVLADLDMLGLRDYIDAIYTLADLEYFNEREEFLFDKSAIITRAVRNFGLQPERGVCIGDFLTDLYSCERAGLVFIGLNDDHERNAILKKAGAKYVVDNLLDATYLALKLIGV